MSIFILLAMIFCHILDDFFIQSVGFLVNGKQRSWWVTNANDHRYRYDYIVCLFAHAFSWTFMMMLPISLVYSFHVGEKFIAFFIMNFLIHAWIDNEKANRKTINLVFDQAVHLCQIIVTFAFLYWGGINK